ncbi:structural cement protein Gp24 [Commensalibacter communis]|uniref:structural cement protein Gp24 n=1 Tax=Commensalibacter communis TaxID=2972786 RepID=UPI0022FF8ACC|nr:hypothetical protein [Commensalibacter communis]CAI3933531.1 unnamed protein product [Commensalibacter communis]CAI3944674.1 unnamed protein product [Commensalibacter communis]
MPFQNKINIGNPIGFNGGFASSNPKGTVFTGGAFNESAFSAGEGGVKSGSFVWYNGTNNTFDNKGTGTPDGFVAKEQQGIITRYLEESSEIIPEGFMVTAYELGEFFVLLPDNMGAVTRKSVVYVDPNTGAITDSSSTGAVKAKYKYAKDAMPGQLVAISSWI